MATRFNRYIFISHFDKYNHHDVPQDNVDDNSTRIFNACESFYYKTFEKVYAPATLVELGLFALFVLLMLLNYKCVLGVAAKRNRANLKITKVGSKSAVKYDSILDSNQKSCWSRLPDLYIRVGRRFLILPIYYSYLKMLLLSVLLEEVYLVVTHDMSDFHISLHNVPFWLKYLLGGFNIGVRYILETSVLFFLLQQNSGRKQIIQVTKYSLTLGAFAGLSWIMLNFATNSNLELNYAVINYWWCGVNFLLLIFNFWVCSTYFSKTMTFGKCSPRPAIYVYSCYCLFTYIIWNIGSALELLFHKLSCYCFYLIGNFFDYVLFAFVVYYTFYRDSLQWRALPQKKSTPMNRDIEEAKALITKISSTNPSDLKLLDFSRLQFKERIGGGATASVYRGILDGVQVVAIKSFYCKILTPQIVTEFIAEAMLMSNLDHPNVVKYRGVCVKPPDICLVTEYCERGSIYQVLHVHNIKLNWMQVLQLSIGCAEGVAYLHRKKIIHRDIKSLNFLVDEDWNVKVADFGQSRRLADDFQMSANKGTLQWIAPEVLQQKRYSEKADVYSLGIVLWEIYTGLLPFDGFTLLDLLHGVCNDQKRPEIPESCPEDYAKLITECWDVDPDKRPDMTEVLIRMKELYKKYFPHSSFISKDNFNIVMLGDTKKELYSISSNSNSNSYSHSGSVSSSGSINSFE